MMRQYCSAATPPHSALAIRSHAATVLLFGCSLALVALTQIAAHGTPFLAPSGAVTHGDWFVVAAALGGVLLHFVRFADTNERTWLILFGIVGVAVAEAVVPSSQDRPVSVAILGLAGASASTQLAMWLQRRRTLRQLVLMSLHQWLLLAATSVAPFFLQFSAYNAGAPFDHNLLAFEDGLNIRFAVAATNLLAIHPWLQLVAVSCYGFVPALLALHCAFSDQRGPNLQVMFVISSALGLLAYHLLPAVGPAVYIVGYYESAWTLLPTSMVFNDNAAQIAAAPRNTFPSLHAVWALFLVWNARWFIDWRRGFFLVTGTLVLLATLAAGHWFIDVVPSMPFALAVQALCYGKRGARALPVLSGTLLVLAWIVAMHVPWFADSSPHWLRWLSIAATAAVTWRLASYLPAPETQRSPRQVFAVTAEGIK